MAIEALTLTSVCYNFLHKYLDSPDICKTSDANLSPLKILDKIRNDKRFDNLFSGPGPNNIEPLCADHKDLVLEYWNLWPGNDSTQQLQASQDAAVALLTQTVPNGTQAYDFFIVHILTTSHAARILLPLIPTQFHLDLIRQWWLLTICVYITQLRPEIKYKSEEISSETSWSYVEEKALKGRWATDPHYIKGSFSLHRKILTDYHLAIRAIKEAAITWGDNNGQYLAAAVKFADGFNGWTGFPSGA